MSRAMDDLNQVPAIIASLGQAIAESQKQFDINYLNGIHALGVIAQKFAAAGSDRGISEDFLNHLISTASPPRYQFTETTLTVKLDLAESKDVMASAGIGFGFAGVVVNAAFSMGYSQDYRAGAEVRTVIHAVLPQENKAVFEILLNRAKELKPAELGGKADMDKNVFEAIKAAAAVTGAKPA